MTQFRSVAPLRAIAIIEAAGIPNARRIIPDHAAAGLVKSYAAVLETIESGGAPARTLGGTIPGHVWKRIIGEGAADDVWTGGTVRLAGSGLIGGNPAVNATAITFHGGDLQRMADRYRDHPEPARAKAPPPPEKDPLHRAEEPEPPRTKQQKKPNPDAIPPGALLATIQQAQDALGISSRTTIYNLIRDGRLKRAENVAGTRITVASIRAYAGLVD